MRPPPAPSTDASRLQWRAGGFEAGERRLAEETAVAIVHDAAASAVMMATPADLEDFAVGFSLTEGIIQHPDEITAIDIVTGDLGIEARLWLTPARRAALAERRRRIAGPTGCGLCGIDSLEAAMAPPPQVAQGIRLAAVDLLAAVEALGAAQSLGAATRAVHAAGFWRPGDGLVALREDVGRHNALDKLAGALARSEGRGDSGAVVLTSRVSVEMVQKTARIGAGLIIAISAPTALAVRTAQICGVTLAAVARSDGFEVFTHPDRIGP